MIYKMTRCAGAALYALAAAVLAFYFWMELRRDIHLLPVGRVVLLLAGCALMYGGGLLIAHHLPEPDRQIPLRLNLAVWFGLYLLLLGTLTLFDDYFGRGAMDISDWNGETLRRYLQYSFNIIPFATVGEIIVKFVRGEIGAGMFVYNIFGNIAALMPTAFFLPLLFRPLRDGRRFALTVTCMVLLIETAQFAMLSGSFDIDDLILNVGGACAAFWLLQRPSVNRRIHRWFLLEQA